MASAILPDLSVVVVVLGGGTDLVRCLEALRRQQPALRTEVIVPHDDGLRDRDLLRARFPEVNFLAVPGEHSYAELRAAGVRASRGRVVAITEDQCIPPEGWCANILEAHIRPHAAIGGPVDKHGPDSALAWAIYLRELGTYMPPVQEGPSECLTDCNVSYKRAALDASAHVWAEAFHEPQVHKALREHGETLWLSPALLTYQQRSLEFVPALKERYEFGRLFGGLRAATVPAGKRLLLALGSPILPVLLVVRIVLAVFGKRRHVGACLNALPYLVLFAAAWSWGELVGYLAGRPPAAR